MGRYTGHIRKLPSGSSFGEIESMQVAGLTAYFDPAAARGAKGPGSLSKGSRVSFEISGSGRAVNIIRSLSNSRELAQKRHQNKAN